MTIIDPNWVEHGYGTRFQGFQNLMRQRIRDILIVSSLYDLYLFEEDGRLYELIRNEYLSLQLSHSPELTRVSKGYEAIALLEEKNFEMVIITLHTEDIKPVKLAGMIKAMNKKFPGLDISIPVVLLAFDNRELSELIQHSNMSVFDKIFIWQGDFRLIIGIIKYFEDRLNMQHDTNMVGVQSILVIEDSIRDYSSFLPVIYTEIIQQSKRLVAEGINLTHKFLRMRARPKIFLAQNYEEAWAFFNEYKEYILGIISDIDFPKGGKTLPRAGIEFAEEVKKVHYDIAILLQSSESKYEKDAHEIGASFLKKGSPTLLIELRAFLKAYFSFGDFVFRSPEGSEIGRAANLYEMEIALTNVPPESIKYHAERNNFSNWFKARTEFWLSEQLRSVKVTDFNSLEQLRKHLITSLRNYRRLRQRGILTDFHKDSFDTSTSFARIGGGSLGGKARGLGFLNILINNYELHHQFEGTRISVPVAVVIGTEVFDQFLDENNLRSFALNCDNDEEIKERFLKAEVFSEEIIANLMSFLDLIKTPLAVRSSSLLEDSQYHPFAGVYSTLMIPNNNPDQFLRLKELVNAVKLVFASTYFQEAKNYIAATSYRHEEEKMAVIIQKMVGTNFDGRFYPTFSGVVKSYNFYPLAPQVSEDGIVAVALGLGKWVVEGGETVRFSPRHPKRIIQFHNPDEALRTTQRSFYALDMSTNTLFASRIEDICTKSFEIETAEKDGTLQYVASTYSHNNHAIYDGISREGTRLITFAPLLKNNLLPLAAILELIVDMGRWGMGTEVEIEFAVNLNVERGKNKEFYILQMRPMVVNTETEKIHPEKHPKSDLICRSDEVLGNGIIDNIRDIIYIDSEEFDRSKSRVVAGAIGYFNSKLIKDQAPYLLVGPGRWGSLDQWLGIPVTWAKISGAAAIIENQFKDIKVLPSQGSHFFHNLTSFAIAYFTVGNGISDSFLDGEWLNSLPVEEQREGVKHIRLKNDIVIKMNATQKVGIILKPTIEEEK